MSAKNRDNKNRWRNITVGFRVSPEENELINKAVALSGLPKQEYCYRRYALEVCALNGAWLSLHDRINKRLEVVR